MKKQDIREKSELLSFFRNEIIGFRPKVKMPSFHLAMYDDLFDLVFEFDRCLYMEDASTWGDYFDGWLAEPLRTDQTPVKASMRVHGLLASVLGKAVCSDGEGVSFGEFVRICLDIMGEDLSAFSNLASGEHQCLTSKPKFSKRYGVRVEVPITEKNLNDLWATAWTE